MYSDLFITTDEELKGPLNAYKIVCEGENGVQLTSSIGFHSYEAAELEAKAAEKIYGGRWLVRRVSAVEAVVHVAHLIRFEGYAKKYGVKLKPAVKGIGLHRHLALFPATLKGVLQVLKDYAGHTLLNPPIREPAEIIAEAAARRSEPGRLYETPVAFEGKGGNTLPATWDYGRENGPQDPIAVHWTAPASID